MALVCALCLFGAWLWGLHAVAWDLGDRSPVLGYDSAQYALAARELSDHGRLSTTFALPIDLVQHPRPPWPLSAVQPGLVLIEAALFKLPVTLLGPGVGIPDSIGPGFHGPRPAEMPNLPDPRDWLLLVLPFSCFLAMGALFAHTTDRLLTRHAPEVPALVGLAGAAVVGMVFLLDPESQHFAIGGLTEMPFTFGLLIATAGVALGLAAGQPLLFGILLGLTGSFRANMLWLAPVFAVAAAATASPGRRARTLVLALAGFLVVGAPWWLYKWRAFGSPGADLTRFVVWDGIGGRTWYSLYHLPQFPELPSGLEAVRLLAMKTLRNLPRLLLDVFTGPRALWVGALAIWALLVGRPRPLLAAALAVLAAFALSLLAAAVSIPWLRYVYPARILAECAGVLALWGILAHIVGGAARPSARALALCAAGLALGWGTWQTLRGLEEARQTSARRDVPSWETIEGVAGLVRKEVPEGEAVMSNLGPVLAWDARRPVVHLPLGPADLEACRRRLEVRHVILVYRDPERAGSEWSEVVAHPEEAPKRPEWNVHQARQWQSADGFRVVWLELGPARPALAFGGEAPGPPRASRHSARAGVWAPALALTTPTPAWRQRISTNLRTSAAPFTRTRAR